MDSRRILFARFRLQHESLRQFKVFVMGFPYWNAIDQFLAIIAKNPARQKEDYPFYDDEHYLPFRRLNSALVLSFSDVIQGFETYSGWHKGVSSGQWFDNRRMIAFALQADEIESMKPDTNRVAYIVEEWLSEWVDTCFKTGRFGNELTLNSNAGQKAYKTLIDTVRNTPITWDEIKAADLWEQQIAKGTQPLHKLAYNVLPSLIAALFIENTYGKTLEVQGVEKSLLIHEWWLTQQGGSENKHLAVVSEPITWVTDKKEGKFSYLLEFVVQTQAGSNNPWVAVYIRIRRWGTKPLKAKKRDRDISVYLRSRSAWVDGWLFSGTLVELKLTGKYPKSKKQVDGELSWVDNPSSLIERLNGGKGRGLAQPNDVVGHPFAHQSGTASVQHEYYILHAEGMTYGNSGKGQPHAVNTGLALKERGQFMKFIIENLQGYLVPDTPMEVDAAATLQVTKVTGKRWNSIRGNPIEAMFTHEDLERVSLLKRGATAEEKLLNKCQITVDALMRASGNRKIRILTFYRGEGGRLVLPHYTRQILFLTDDTELPVTIELVSPIPIPGVLGDVPAQGYKEKKGKEQKRYIYREWRDKRDEWEKFLSQYVEDDAYNLAFIEMDNPPNLEDCSDLLKKAMRNAAIRVGINTQMINSIPADALQKTLQRAGDLSRVINANYDLMLRQTALSYGLLSQIYRLAGLSEDTANSLVTVGLYRYTGNKPVNADYPLAVVSYPNGETWVILPDAEGNPCEPIRYIEAGIQIGQIFATGDERLFNYYNEKGNNKGYRLRHFVEELLLKANSWNQPCLIMMEAEWRKYNVLPIGNERLEYNELAINNAIYTPEKLPNLRLIRMRDVGTMNETPQYVELREGETWQDSHDADDPDVMTGVEDVHCGSEFLHYYSIGRQPEAIASRSEKVEKAIGADWNELPTFEANEAHKHQQAIEFVPFFMQSGDDKLTYCRIAHFLRYSPAWRGGNLVLPHQLHLAKTLLDDLRDVFEPKSK